MNRLFRFLGALLSPLFLASSLHAQVSYEFIVDLSGSMNRYIDGGSLRNHALKALSTLLPENDSYAVRVFGHRVGLDNKITGCKDSELIVPFGVHQDANIVARLVALEARGFTPLAYSLRFVAQDLAATKGKRVVILLSDGADSCEGDPVQEIAALRASGFDVLVNPIGIAVEPKARQQLAELASMTGGIFHEVHSPAELSQALGAALAHVAGEPRKLTLPGDLGGEIDAGSVPQTALSIRKNEWMNALLGAKRGELRDDTDYFSFTTVPGEKFVLQLKILSGTNITAQVLTGAGVELGVASNSSLESEPIISAEPEDKPIFIHVGSSDVGEVRYQFKIVPLVEIVK